MSEQIMFHTLTKNGNTYLRLSDVIEYLRQIGATEDNDVRMRLDAAAINLCVLKDKNES